MSEGSQYVQVEGHSDLVRDTQSHAIVNRNRGAYELAKKRAAEAHKKNLAKALIPIPPMPYRRYTRHLGTLVDHGHEYGTHVRCSHWSVRPSLCQRQRPQLRSCSRP